jgi:predicted lipoprotein with Yx(FWY)xxD motif
MTPPNNRAGQRSDKSRPGLRHVARKIGVGALLVLGLTGLAAAAQASTSAPVVTASQVRGFGTLVVSDHRVVYVFSHDPKGHSTCSGACAKLFPPVLVSAKLQHHLGHLHGLGTIHRPHGRLQVTLHGHPLYFFSGDRTLTRAGGEALDNVWFVVRPNGTVVRQAPASTHVAPVGAVPPVGSGSTTTSSPGKQNSGTSTPTSTVVKPAASQNSPQPTSPPVTATTSPPATTQPTSPPATTQPTSPPTTTRPTNPPTTTTTAPTGGGVSF